MYKKPNLLSLLDFFYIDIIYNIFILCYYYLFSYNLIKVSKNNFFVNNNLDINDLLKTQ